MEVGAYRVRLEYDLLAQLLPLSLAASRLSAADVSLWSLWSLDGPLPRALDGPRHWALRELLQI